MSLGQLTAALLLLAPVVFASTNESSNLNESLESLWTLDAAEFNTTLESAAANISVELQAAGNFTANFAGYDSVNLTEPLRRIRRAMRLTETMLSQLNASQGDRGDQLVATLRRVLENIRFDWPSSVGEKSLESCYSQFLSRMMAVEAESALSLSRLWEAASSSRTNEQLRRFFHMTSTYHSDLSGRLVRFLSKADGARAAKTYCADGGLRLLYALYVGSSRQLMRAAAVQLGLRQLGRAAPHLLPSSPDSRWDSELELLATQFSEQLSALWRGEFRSPLASDVGDLLTVAGSPTPELTASVLSLLGNKYYYVRFAWLRLPPVAISDAGLKIWPPSSEFVCFSRAAFASAKTLVLLCRNGQLSQLEEAAAAAEWLRLRQTAGGQRDSIPATLLQAVRSFRLSAGQSDSAAAVLRQLVTPSFMKVILPAAGNTSFLAAKMATVSAEQTVQLSSSDDSFAVSQQQGSVFYLVCPVRLSWEYVPSTKPSPKSATRPAAGCLPMLLLLLLLLLSLLLRPRAD